MPENEIPSEDEMVSDMKALEVELPFKDYGREAKKLRELVSRLEKDYDKREKVITRILRYGTGIESEKALRMYSTPVLERWEAALEEFRAENLKRKK